MALRSTIQDLQFEVDRLIAQRGMLAAELGELDELISQLLGAIKHLSAQAGEFANQAPAKTIRNAMVEIFQEHGSAMHYGSLLPLLLRKGVEVNGKDPLRLVAAHLSNDDRFVSVGNGVWGLNSWPERVLKESSSNRRETGDNSGGPQTAPIRIPRRDQPVRIDPPPDIRSVLIDDDPRTARSGAWDLEVDSLR